MPLEQITIPKRFCGPSHSGNGGYSCGALADFLPADAEVTLRSPPPLDTPLDVRREADGSVTLLTGETTVAVGRPTQLTLDLPDSVSPEQAVAASRDYVGFKEHPYPECFVCGPKRPAHDGLGLFPGAVPDRKVVAAPWTPSRDLCDDAGVVRPRFVWASLDCPSWFGYAAFHPPGLAILLGRLSVHIERRPSAGDSCVVMGWELGRDGRKISCGSAVFESSGEAIAWGQATWIVLKE